LNFSRPVIVLFAASILWGLSWLPLKGINAQGIDGIAMIFGSYGLLALALTPLLILQYRTFMQHKKAMALIALFGGGANLAFSYALIEGDVIRVMVLFYLLPLWGVLGGKIFLKEQIDPWRWMGAGLAIIGAVFVLGGFGALSAPLNWIDLVALLSGLFFAMNNLVFRAVQAVPVGSKIAVMFYGCFVIAALLLLGGFETFPMEADTSAWAMVAAYAFLWLLVANIGSQWGVTHMEAGRSSIIIIMELITAVISAAIIAGETMKTIEMFGGVLILTAALIEALRSADDDKPKTQIQSL